MFDEQYFSRRVTVNGITLVIGQEIETDVGGVVWDSALVATHFFAQNPQRWKGKKVLELGAGTGVCSLVLASMGADVICTDLPERLALIEWNLKKNEHALVGNLKIRALDWCQPDDIPSVDVILFVDCIYYNSSVDPLISTILRTPSSESFCFYEKRDIGEPVIAQAAFLEKISTYFNLHYLTAGDLDPVYCCEEIIAFRMVRK